MKATGLTSTIRRSAPRGVPATLWAQAWDDPAPIVRIETGKSTLWLKKAAKPPGYWRYRLLAFAAKGLRFPILSTRPPKGWDAAIQLEARRIRELAKAGVRVPEIIACDSDWLVLTDLGVSLDYLLDNNSEDLTFRQRLMDQTLSTLLQVHQRGQYLSQCFARNVVLDRENHNQVGFIDLEEDPIEFMDLETAQARDILLLLKSTAHYFEDDLDGFRHQFIGHISEQAPEVRKTLRDTVTRLQWVRSLPARSLLGRDYRRMEAALRAFAGAQLWSIQD